MRYILFLLIGLIVISFGVSDAFGNIDDTTFEIAPYGYKVDSNNFGVTCKLTNPENIGHVDMRVYYVTISAGDLSKSHTFHIGKYVKELVPIREGFNISISCVGIHNETGKQIRTTKIFKAPFHTCSDKPETNDCLDVVPDASLADRISMSTKTFITSDGNPVTEISCNVPDNSAYLFMRVYYIYNDKSPNKQHFNANGKPNIQTEISFSDEYDVLVKCTVRGGTGLPSGNVVGYSKFVKPSDVITSDKPLDDIDITLLEVPDKPRKGNGGCADCTPPTFGKTSYNKWIVKEGFSFNGNSTDVTNYHTEYPLITVKTNQTNNLTLTAYENYGTNNMKWIQFGLGMPEVGSPLNDAQTLVTIWLNHGEVEKIEKQEKYPLVDISNVTTSIVECGYTTSDCLQVSMDYIYRDQPKYNIMAINAMDNSRNSIVNFLNDGISVLGESLNEPLLDKISVSKGGAFYPQRAGIVELTLVDYKTDMWQDKYGYLWTGDNYKSFKIIDTVPAPIREPDVMWSAMTRINSNFAGMIIAEEDRAILYFDASKLISIPDEPWSYDFPQSKVMQQKELEIRLAVEADRAEKELKEYFDHIYPGMVQD